MTNSEAQRSSAASSVVPVHTCVRGRARIAVRGLKGAPDLARRIEHRLARHASVTHVQARAVTGNVTVQFEPSIAMEGLIELITTVLRGDTAGDAEPSWHKLGYEEVAEHLLTSVIDGLSEPEAGRRLVAHGPNELRAGPERSPASILAGQFTGLPVAILAGAAVLSVVSGGLIEAGAIAAVLALNGLIGFVTETRTEATIRAASASGPRRALVKRGGRPRSVATSSLVPGDLLIVQRGTVVAADARIASADALSVSEAGLTGESRPVLKRSAALGDGHVALADRTNMLYRGTVVTGGSGTAVVVNTGSRTEAGRIQRLVEASRAPETPTSRQLRVLGAQLGWLTCAAGLLLFAVGRWRGFGFGRMARSAMSLAVASVPEGLPMIATSAHAVGVAALRGHNVLVRRLDAIETLASVNVVCFDKTGTLTENRMSVAEIRCGGDRIEMSSATGDEAFDGRRLNAAQQRMFEIACLCSEVEVAHTQGIKLLGESSTESALISCAARHGFELEILRQSYRLVQVQQRREGDRLMATAHACTGTGTAAVMIAVKGSPDEVLSRCTRVLGPDGSLCVLDEAARASIARENEDMAQAALRVLGFAFGYSAEPDMRPLDQAAQSLIWVGLAGLSDRLRSGAEEVIRRLHGASIRTVMLTGDQCITARAVANKIGLSGKEPLEVIDMGSADADIRAAAGKVHVFARITPGQKLRVLKALQASGAVVAMIGDGVNDSPALRGADVGFAMGLNGDEAAREVADIFLKTDDLGSIVAAIEQGRTTHDNVRKALRFLLATNASEIALMINGTGVGMGEPLTPLQLLWINVISDVLPGIGLTLEPSDEDVMSRPPPAADAALLGPGQRRRLLTEGGVLSAGAFAAGLYGVARYGAASPRMQTITFGSLIVSQLLHAFNCRHEAGAIHAPADRPTNATLAGIIGGSLLMQSAMLIVPPLRNALGLSPIGLVDLVVMAATSLVPYLANRGGGALGDLLQSPDTIRFERRAPVQHRSGSKATL